MSVKQKMVENFKNQQMGEVETQGSISIQYEGKRVQKVFKKMLTLQSNICQRNALVQNKSIEMKRTDAGTNAVETANEEVRSSENV